MGFKLGTEKGNYAVSGEIKTKMRFDKESGDPDLSVPGTPIIRKRLEPGILGEANMDGSIYISDNATDMKIGKTGYADDHVMYNGEKFPRETRNGKDMILVDGEWKEAGDDDFPWEHDANNGVII